MIWVDGLGCEVGVFRFGAEGAKGVGIGVEIFRVHRFRPLGFQGWAT